MLNVALPESISVVAMYFVKGSAICHRRLLPILCFVPRAFSVFRPLLLLQGLAKANSYLAVVSKPIHILASRLHVIFCRIANNNI